MEEVYYNDTKHIAEIALGQLNDKGKYDNVKTLFLDNVSNYTIISDLVEPMLKVELFIKENDYQLISSYPIDGRSTLKVFVKSLDESSNQNMTFDHSFIIDDIVPVDFTNDGIFFKITGTSELYPVWMKHQCYSTGKTEKCTTDIIEEIIKKTKIKVSKDKFFESSLAKTKWITPVNVPIRDSINELLQLSVNPYTGMYFLGWDFLKNQFNFISVFDRLRNGEIETYNVNKIPTKYGFTDKEVMTKNLTSNNLLSGVSTLEYGSKYIMNNYSYTGRRWDKNEYEHKRMNKIFDKHYRDGNQKSGFKDVPDVYKQTSPMEVEMGNNQFAEFGKRMQELFRFMDVVQFDTQGYMKRNVGDMFFITSDGDNPIVNRYKGTWLITRIYHDFSKNKYNHNLSLARVYREKEKFTYEQ